MDKAAVEAQAAFKILCEILFPEEMTLSDEAVRDGAFPTSTKGGRLSAKSFTKNGHIGFCSFGNDPFVVGLEQVDREHRCLVVGTVRPELMLEMVWERIILSGGRVKPHELDTRRLLVSIDAFIFDITYRVLTANLNLDDVEYWNRVRSHLDTRPSFDKIYQFLVREWAPARGVLKTCLQPEGLTATKIIKMIMDTYEDYNGSRELSDEVSYILKAFFERHSKPQSYWPGPSAIDWEFRRMCEVLENQEHLDLDALQLPSGVPDMESMLIGCLYLVDVSITTLSASERECGLAMERVEEVIRKSCKEAAMSLAAYSSTKPSHDIYVRCWPHRLVSEQATTNDVPYEGHYRVAILQRWTLQPGGSESSTESDHQDLSELTIRNTADVFSSKIHILMATNKAISVRAEIIETQETGLRRCHRQWPMRVAVPPSEIRLESPAGMVIPEKRTSVSTAPATEATSSPATVFLRPAADVLSRLRHDDAYKLDDFVVGYEDRHAGIMEKAAADWITETTSDQFIPQSRIVYFRDTSPRTSAFGEHVPGPPVSGHFRDHGSGGGGKVWDRRSKRDLIFGTGCGAEVR
ncbi:duf455 domain-containing protein [Phlyctema vagabunda]|uniref:Duf455 domain-containing protein n=1 Tax=Phlyctema vagabunda TaxID=108571 RepID=A0ABR4PYF6_9HELO